jgi:hypothetical protein
VRELRDRSPIEVLRDRNPIEFVKKRADLLAQRSADLKRLADAWEPLYQTLARDQKRRMALVALFALRELRDAAEECRMRSEDENDAPIVKGWLADPGLAADLAYRRTFLSLLQDEGNLRLRELRSLDGHSLSNGPNQTCR